MRMGTILKALILNGEVYLKFEITRNRFRVEYWRIYNEVLSQEEEIRRHCDNKNCENDAE